MGTWVSVSARAKAIAVLGVAAFVAASCSSPDPVTPEWPIAARLIDDSSTTAAAANFGTLVQIGECLALENADGELWTIVFADGRVEWDAELMEVTMDRGPGRPAFTARVGDAVELAGQSTSSTSNFDWATEPNDSCPNQYLITG